MKILAVAAIAILAAATCVAQAPVPREEQFQVNAYTTSEQSNPSLAADSSGAYVVVWSSDGSDGPDTSRSSIWGRRYAADGTPLGDEFPVNSYAVNFQITPAVAARPSGEFVVVWGSSSSGFNDSFYSIQGQRFGADGSPVDGEFQVNTYTTNVQESPAVAVADDGAFMVVWQSVGSFGADNSARSIQAQLYASDGSASGGQLQVNTFSLSDQADPAVAVDDNGNFVIVWFSVGGSGGSDTSGRSVQGQVVASNGDLIGGEFQVNSYTTNNQYNPSVTVAPGGEFVVVWSGNGSPGNDDGYAVLGQLYDSDGLVVGDEFQVNTYTTSVQSMPVVASAENGDFVVAWRSGEYAGSGPDGDKLAVSAQAYSADGAAAGGEFIVNSYTTSHQTTPAVAAADSRGFVMTWQSDGSYGDDLDESVQARRYGFADLFADGFEAGDMSAWDSFLTD